MDDSEGKFGSETKSDLLCYKIGNTPFLRLVKDVPVLHARTSLAVVVPTPTCLYEGVGVGLATSSIIARGGRSEKRGSVNVTEGGG